MNTKTLDNTANDPWADIAHSDLVNYVRNTGHFRIPDTEAPGRNRPLGAGQVTGWGWRGRTGPVLP